MVASVQKKGTENLPHSLVYVASASADQDREIRSDFLKHLRSACKMQRIEVWCDQEITPGLEYASEIAAHLDQASLILFLVSPDFLYEESIIEQVVTPSMARHEAGEVMVIPIRLIPVSWRGVAFGHLQPLPVGKKAVTEAPDRNRAFVDMVEEIVDILLKRVDPNDVEFQGRSITSSPASPPRRSLELAAAAANEHTLKLADALSREIDHRLDGLRESYRAGRHGEALTDIRELNQYPAWESLDHALRGKILRTRAIYEIQAGTDSDAVETLVFQAAEIDPEGDDRSARAVLAYQLDDIEKALDITASADTLACLNLHLALLLENQQIDAARRLLEAVPAHVEPDAETKRLAAILALMVGDIRLARETLDEGASLQPNCWSLQELSVIIEFWGSCVPVALAKNHPLMPRPFAPEMVRYDDEARGRRRDAAARFAKLAQESDDEKAQWRCRFWMFLCFLLDAEKRPEAEQMLANLLDTGQSIPFTLSWALAFDLEFNRNKVEQLLRAATPEQRGYLDNIGFLASHLENSGRGEEALRLLEDERERFFSAGASLAWRRWFVSALVASGKQEKAEEIAREEPDTATRNSLLILCADQRYRNGGDWRPVFELFDSGYRESGDVSMLVQACYLKGQSGEWSYVRENTDTLLNHMATSPVIRLVARAAWECNDPTRCRDILDRYAERFPEKRLPEHLRRLRVACLRRLGLLNEAVEGARENWEATRSWESLIALLEAQVQQGDIDGAGDSARALLGFSDGDAKRLLWVAEVLRIRPAHGDLARALWRRAIEIGSDDTDFAMPAYMTGMALGLREELLPLMGRIHEAASNGSSAIRLVSLEEAVSLMVEGREQMQQLWEKYNRGEFGIQMLGNRRRAMAHFFYTVAAANRVEPDARKRTSLWVRHGARPVEVLGPNYRFGGRLVMDVTALLLAHDLGILGEVERHFAPIFVSSRLPSYLGKEIHELQPAQPSRLKAITDVDVMVRAGGIELVDAHAMEVVPANEFEQAMGAEWLGIIHSLRAEGGALMEFYPLATNDLKHTRIELPTDFSPYVTSPRAVLERLRDDGVVDADHFNKALSRLGNDAAGGDEWPAPNAGQRLLIPPELAILLEEAEILRIIVARYRVGIFKQTWEEVYRPELQIHREDQKTAKWLSELLGRVKDGLRTGKYSALPEEPTPDEDQESSPMPPVRESGLWDLLHYQGATTDLVWADDRWLNGYPGINATPLVGVLEILRLLRSKDWTNEAYYRTLFKLRAGNYRYFPLLADEILYWLPKAPITKGRMQETPELAVLRRYSASILLDEKCLRITGKVGDKPEAALISQSISAVQEALTLIWQKHGSYSKQQARAQWVLDALYTGLGHLDHFVDPPSPELRRSRVGLDLVGLLYRGMLLDARPFRHGENETSIQQQYVQWVVQAIVSPRLATDPECAVFAAELLCRHIGTVLDNFNKESNEQKHTIRAIMIRFIRFLPDTIREEMCRNNVLMKQIGFTFRDVLNVGGYEFDLGKFWQAAAQTFDQSESPLRDMKGQVFWIKAEEGGGTAILSIKLIPKNKKKSPLSISDDRIGVLSNHPDKRREILNRHPSWRDGLDIDVDSLNQMLGNIDSPSERIDRLNEWRERSAASFYVDVEIASQSEKGLTHKNFLPPQIAALLRYFRLGASLSSDKSFEECWERAAQRLLNDVGLEEALKRAVCLPVPLPGILLDALKTSQDAVNCFERLERYALSPVSCLHVIDLGLALGNQLAGVGNTFARTIEHLSSERLTKDFKLMQAILLLSRRSLACRQDFRELPAMLKLSLIWGHALTVQNRILRHIELTDEAPDLLENHAKAIPWSIFDDAADLEKDVSYPAHVFAPHLVYHALGRVLNRHPAASWMDIPGLPAIREELHGLVEGQAKGHLLLYLAADTSLQTDVLASLFGGDRETALEPFLGNESSWFSSERRKAEVVQLLEKLEVTPNDAGLWFALHLSFLNAEIYPDLKAKCALIAQNVGLSRLYDDNPNVALVAVRMIFSWREDGQAAEEDLQRLVLERFQTHADRGKESAQQYAIWITECAYWLCRQEKCREDFDKRFTGLMERLLRISSTFTVTLAPVILSLSQQFSAVDYPGLQRLVLVVRTGADPL